MPTANFTHSFWSRWGPAIFFMVLIFAFSSIPSQQVPDFGQLDLSMKKGGHMLGYAFLAAAYLRGLGKDRPNAPYLAWILAVLYALTDEFHQAFVPGRGPWIVDIGIDAFGALIGLIPSSLVRSILLR